MALALALALWVSCLAQLFVAGHFPQRHPTTVTKGPGHVADLSVQLHVTRRHGRRCLLVSGEVDVPVVRVVVLDDGRRDGTVGRPGGQAQRRLTGGLPGSGPTIAIKLTKKSWHQGKNLVQKCESSQ